VRQRFVCTQCGLQIEGRLNPTTGEITAYDRGPASNEPPEPCLCRSCLNNQKEKHNL